MHWTPASGDRRSPGGAHLSLSIGVDEVGVSDSGVHVKCCINDGGGSLVEWMLSKRVRWVAGLPLLRWLAALPRRGTSCHGNAFPALHTTGLTAVAGIHLCSAQKGCGN